MTEALARYAADVPSVGFVDNATAKIAATGHGNADKTEMVAAALERWGETFDTEVDRWGAHCAADLADACWIAEVIRDINTDQTEEVE